MSTSGVPICGIPVVDVSVAIICGIGWIDGWLDDFSFECTVSFCPSIGTTGVDVGASDEIAGVTSIPTIPSPPPPAFSSPFPTPSAPTPDSAMT